VNNPKACIIENSSNKEHAHATVTLRSGRRVDSHVAELEADHKEELKADLAERKEKESDNKEERDAKPSIVTPIDKDPPRSFIPKASYPERLKAPKKNA
jgi:hypothetical protein